MMAMLVLDPSIEERILELRRDSGAERYDEIWDGVYIVFPPVDNEHQELVSGLIWIFHPMINAERRGIAYAGVNISDRLEDFSFNCRCPDFAVFLPDTTARNCETHYCGGPDFAVEIVSKGDRSREKLEFYAKVNTKELLVIDRYPWALELYRLVDGALTLVGKRTPGEEGALASEVVPLSFRLVEGAPRPEIEVGRLDGGGDGWRI